MLAPIKQKIIRLFYRFILKPIFFRIDPETIHNVMAIVGIELGKYKLTRKLTKLLFFYSDPSLRQNIVGIEFANPIGLAAGFDKNAQLTQIMPEVGFGFMEAGSITANKCDGNPKPRLSRLPRTKSLIVNYGLKNNGAEEISSRLKKMDFEFPVGISIAKTNDNKTVTTKDGVKDYLRSVRIFRNIGSYITLNISCPNAFDGESFLDTNNLEQLLDAVSHVKKNKPIFVKVSSNVPPDQLEKIIEVSERYNIDGYICSNLSKNRKSEKVLDKLDIKGGISGKVLKEDATDQVSYIYKKTGGRKLIIGCGGVSTAEEAYEKIKAGASLIQLITGMIFEGPQLIGEINHGLAKLLKADGYDNISEVVGIGHK
jgi:dihydroorotate dehydrogenase